MVRATRVQDRGTSIINESAGGATDTTQKSLYKLHFLAGVASASRGVYADDGSPRRQRQRFVQRSTCYTRVLVTTEEQPSTTMHVDAAFPLLPTEGEHVLSLLHVTTAERFGRVLAIFAMIFHGTSFLYIKGML